MRKLNGAAILDRSSGAILRFLTGALPWRRSRRFVFFHSNFRSQFFLCKHVVTQQMAEICRTCRRTDFFASLSHFAEFPSSAISPGMYDGTMRHVRRRGSWIELIS
jgi:hypothetical protein